MESYYIKGLHKVAALPGTFINVVALLIAVALVTMGITMALRYIAQRRADKRAVRARLGRLTRNSRGEVVILALGIIAIIGCVAMVAGAAWPDGGTFWHSWPW